MKRLALLLALLSGTAASFAAAESKPNILLIVADDLGYADVGFQGCKDIPTPNLDQLAKRSLRCTNGYVTHPFCSPTRAGLLTGRYQQHFGHENNPVWNPEDTVSGLPLSQTTLPQVLKTAGYVTGAVGKWHLGAHPQFHPNRRGFDDYVGFLGGGHIYLPGAKGGAEYNIPINRNGVDEPLKEYITDFFGHEGSAFISRHKSEPWFLYLAFNAPHTPLQATEKQLSRVSGITDEIRRNYGGLVVGLDDAVGEVLATLHTSGQDEKTLVFFMSDNGGPVSVTHSDNAPLRGAKGQVFEGGMRVPFLVSWPGRLAQGKDYALPVSSLDVFATAVALTGAKVPAEHQLDGVNILPFLMGEKPGAPHEHLFWRTANGTWAIREGDWKLLNMNNPDDQCYNLAADIGEASDRAAEKPDVTAKLKASYAAWNAENIAPVFAGPAAVRAKKKLEPK
ncbi:MAG: sulfatase-like hydrolase/transferase [Chthoniobacteraceae bacterium]